MNVTLDEVGREAIETAKTRELLKSGRARAIRELSGLSKSELARSIGASPSTVGRWEAGLRVPKGEMAKRYGRMLRELAAGVK